MAMPEKKNIRKDISDYIGSKYLRHPTSDESVKWISIKRHSIPADMSKQTKNMSKGDGNRMLLRYVLKKMKHGKDLDMLVQAMFFIKHTNNKQVLFVSADSDHLAVKEYLWIQSDHKLLVTTIPDAIALLSRQ